MSKFKINIHYIIIGIIILVLIIFKSQVIALPYFGDEAFPYSIAVRTLLKSDLSLMPTAIPPELSRGHPLVFHFLAAL